VRQQVQVALRGLLLELLAQARLLLAAQPLGVGLLVGRERLLRLVALVALCAQRVVGPTRPLLGCCRRVVLVVLKPVLLVLGRQVVEAAAVHRAALGQQRRLGPIRVGEPARQAGRADCLAIPLLLGRQGLLLRTGGWALGQALQGVPVDGGRALHHRRSGG